MHWKPWIQSVLGGWKERNVTPPSAGYLHQSASLSSVNLRSICYSEKDEVAHSSFFVLSLPPPPEMTKSRCLVTSQLNNLKT